MKHETAARAALKALVIKCGGSRQLGEILGVTRQAVEAWDLIPLIHLRTTKARFGLGLRELRPDIADYL